METIIRTVTSDSPRKFVSLLSGGIDSPVAAYQLARYGFQPVFVSFLSMASSARQAQEDKITKQVHQVLEKARVGNATLYLLTNRDFMDLIVAHCPEKLTCLLCKRMMIRVANAIAREERAEFLASGDILGEQASQTLLNLHIYKDICTEFPFFRPLLGWDKVEVIRLAQELGTYEVSNLSEPACEFIPQYPETRGKLSEIQTAEQQFPVPIPDLVEQLLSKSKKIIF